MDFLDRHKKIFIVIAVIICIGLTIVTAKYRFQVTLFDEALSYVVTPAQKLATNVSRHIGGVSSMFADTSELQAENKRLKDMVDVLAAENRRLKLVEAESKSLTELLKVDEKYPDFPKIGARAIATDTSNWFNSFIIDKGKQDGVTENLVVLSSGGLVGRTVKSANAYSEVLTIIDEESAVSVKCIRTDDIGLLKGNITLMKNGLCRMDFIDIDAEIMEGDELVTSQWSDIYPPGITVGYVKEVRLDDKALTKYAVVLPSVDFQNIDTVLVISERYNSLDMMATDIDSTEETED